MRASMKNLVLAEGDQPQQIEWQTTKLYDAPVEFPLTLSITRENLALGRTNIRACAIAQSMKSRDFSYFGVGVDVVHVGAFVGTEPVRLRYRSGCLPRKFDKAVAQLQKTGVFDVRHLETEKYVLRPPSKTQSLENKKTQNQNDRLTRKKPAKRRNNNQKPNVKEFVGRGRLNASA